MGMGWAGRRWLGLVAAASLWAGCHEPGQTRSVEATATVDVRELDFGEVPVGEWVEAEVGVLNIGVVPFFALEALGLEKNPSYDVQLGGQDRVEPGESKQVKVRFRPLTEGEHHEVVKLETDANSGTEAPIPVRGLGGPARIGLEPPVLDFETLEVDSERSLSLSVTNPTELPLTLVIEGSDGTPFTTDTVTLPPLSTQQVQAQYFPHQVKDDGARLELRACDGCTPAVVELKGKSVANAFVYKPTPVPFQEIPVHERTESKTRARNITWRPVTLQKLSTSDVSFTPLTTHQGQVVEPGAEVEIHLAFAARSSGPKEGTLSVDYTSNRPRQSQVALDARGGQPTLAVAPIALDFGELPVGAKMEQTVRITNAGTYGELAFLGVRGGGNSEHFSVGPASRGTQVYGWTGTWPHQQTGPLLIVPGADAIDVKVYFEPRAVGAFQAELTLITDAPFHPERTIVLTGSARSIGVCQFTLLPQPAMDFGNVPVGQGAALGFRFSNTGADECAVKDIHLSDNGGGAFFLPGGEITGGVLQYDTAFSAMVAFRAPAEGDFSGTLRITLNHPTNPVVELPLRAVAQATCLAAAPPYLDFGPVRYDCSPDARTTFITNQCAWPVTVNRTWIGEGTSQQFSLENPITAPRVLAPAEGFELVAHYERNVLGQHFSPLYLQAEGEGTPRMVPLLAETNHDGLQQDSFIQGTDSQLDVLFVLSNTTTMAPFQARLSAAIPGWMRRARSAGVDLRIGVTTTGLVERSDVCPGGARGGEAGRLFPADGSRGRVVTSGTENAVTQLRANLNVGICHNLVQGLETLRQALSSPLIDRADDSRTPLVNDGNLGLLRGPARLAVIVLSDEDDHSGFEAESYVQFLQALKGTGSSHRTQLYGLLPTGGGCTTAGPSAPRFAEVAERTGGTIDSLCQADYGPLLDQVLQRAGGAQADFPLTEQPDGISGMTVQVGGVVQDPSLWIYQPERNAVLFQPGAIPSSGQQVQVRYRSVCRGAP